MHTLSVILRALIAIWLGATFIFIADGILVSSASLLLERFSASKHEIGLVNACFFAGALACMLLAHKIISVFGYLKAFYIFSIIFALSAIFGAFNSNLIFWGILRFFMGFSYYSSVMVFEVWINSKINSKIRSRVFAFYEVLFYITFGLGSLFIAFELSATKLLIISTLFIIIAIIPMKMTTLKAPQTPKVAKINFPNIFLAPKLSILAALIAGICINGFFSMASLFGSLSGFNDSKIAAIIMAAMCGGAFGHAFFGVFSDKYGREFAILLASFVSFCASFCLLFKEFLYIGVFMLGFGIFVLYVLSLALASDKVKDKALYINASRSMLFSYLLGSLLSAPILGLAMSAFSHFGFIYFYIILCGTLFAVFAISLRLNRIKDDNYQPA